MTTDVWMQHPTLRFLQHDMFDSLRRWTGQEVPSAELPLEVTLAVMDEAGVDRGFVCAWYGPDGLLISNDEVAQWVGQHPDRLTGWRRWTCVRRWRPFASYGARCTIWAAGRCGSSRGSGGCRRTIGSTTRCSPSA